MKYRNDIDGLRAVALLPVLIYHAKLGIFNGGFIGVDIFFVISGFLITSILIEEITQQRFSFANFYERRIRRLLPALIFMVAVTTLLAYFFLITVDLKSYGKSLIALSFFSSNIFFWLESGYFDRAAELKPLLHTWSLAVEEQYYFFFPLVLLFVLRFIPKLLIASVLTILLASLALATWAAYNSPDAAFYLLPTRAWELMFGSLASLLIFYNGHYTRHVRWAGLLKNLSLLVVLLSLVFFTNDLPHPALPTVIPVLATLLLIIIPAENSLAHRLLTMKWMVFVGIISYSLYLWHFPLLVFNQYISSNPTIISRILMLLAAFALAYISWRYIEYPFRNRQRTSRRQVYTFCGVSFAAIITFGVMAGQHGLPDRYSDEQLELMAYLDYDSSLGSPEDNAHCFLDEDETQVSFSPQCITDSQNILVWGDSHANALAKGLRYELSGAISELTSSACLPIVGIHFPHRPHCEEVNEFILRTIKRTPFSSVIMHGNWLSHPEKIASMSTTLAALDALNIPVHLIGGVPQYSPDLPSFMLTKQLLLTTENSSILVEQPLYEDILALDRMLMDFAGEFENVHFVSALDAFCPTPEQCVTMLPSVAPGKGWVPTAWDYGHLTLEGAITLGKSVKLPEQ